MFDAWTINIAIRVPECVFMCGTKWSVFFLHNSVYLSTFTVRGRGGWGLGGRVGLKWVWFHLILKCTYRRTLKITNMLLHIFLCKYLYISDILLIESLITVVHFFSYKFSDWADFFYLMYCFLIQQLQWFYFRFQIIIHFFCSICPLLERILFQNVALNQTKVFRL